MRELFQTIKRLLFKAAGQKGNLSKEVPPEDRGKEARASIPEGLEGTNEHEMGMIKAILHLARTRVREIMVPWVDIMAMEVNEPVSEAVRRMVETGHGRLPVYEETIDSLIGIVHSRDLLRFVIEDSSNISLRDLVRPVLFIPESKRLNDLLQEFQDRRMQIAIVVDEYGGTSGLVTIEDLLEEVVGDIEDEFAQGEPQMEIISENEVLVDSRVSINQLRELLTVAFEGDDYDTLGGFLYSRLGKIPKPGDEITADGLRIHVLSTNGRRIRKVRIQKVGA